MKDFTPHYYQDDLDTDAYKTDEITHEITDEPSDTLGIPNQAIKEDLDREALDELEHSTTQVKEDMREMIEDEDQGDLANPDQTDAKS